MYSQKLIIVFIILTTFLFLVLLSLVLTILSLHKKRQLSYMKELELMRSDYENELLTAQLEIQEQTFNHISLELHDNVGHFISLAKLYLSTISGPDEIKIQEKVEETLDLLSSSLDEIR